MAVPNQLPKTPCLDDYPEPARLGARQQFIFRWSQPIALIPLGVLIVVVLKFFPGLADWRFDVLFAGCFVWIFGLTGYSIYLLAFGGIRCPTCDQRFGIGNACRNCHLPRNRRIPFTLPNLTANDDQPPPYVN